MPTSIIAPVVIGALGIGAGTVAAAAVTLGVRLLTTYVVSNLVLKKLTPASGTRQTGAAQPNPGTRIQLPPATNNRLPIVYGTAWTKPVITDAKISIDQKKMWYVCALSEVPDGGTALGTSQFSFDKFIWGGSNTLNFDPVDPTRVISWTNTAGQTETKIDGKIHIYCYRDGSLVGTNTSQSAIDVLSDAAIDPAQHWQSTDLMSKTAFMIVEIDYDQENGLTGLGEITVQLTNTLDKPGGAILDYLTNPRYGCAIDLTSVDTQSLININAYADQLIDFTPVGGGPQQQQKRYTINGLLDSNQDCFTNLAYLTDACDSWLQWNEADAKWGVCINKAYDQTAGSDTAKSLVQLFDINENNVIGAIDFNPVDLNSTYNEIETTYPDTNIRDQASYAYVDLPEEDRNPNEPNNLYTMNLYMVNNYVQARYLSTRKLIQSREDLIVRATLDYSGIQIDAGDLVRFNNDKYGWVNKVFRVTQVQEGKDDSGFLSANLTMTEYNPQIYQNIDIEDYVPSPNTSITDPTILPQPPAPTFANITPDAGPPSFEVEGVTPTEGITIAMEFWYGPTSDIVNNNYLLYETQFNSSLATYTQAQTETILVTGLPEGSWYWKVRAIGASTKSAFSESSLIIWEPIDQAGAVGADNAAADLSDMFLVPFVNGTGNWADDTRGIMPAGGTSLIALANPGSIRVTFSSSIFAPNNSQFNCIEVWKSIASEVFTKKVYAIGHSYDVTAGQAEPSRLQALGLNMDYISDDGGATWSQYDAQSTTRFLAGQISLMSANATYPYTTFVAGPYQDADGASTQFVNMGNRNNLGGTELPPVSIKYTYIPRNTDTNRDITTGFNNLVLVDNTGGTSGYRRASMAVGDNGIIAFYSNAFAQDFPIGMFASAPWYVENSNTLQNLYDVYANPATGAGNYTVIVVGGFGTILKSDRTGVGARYGWSSKSVSNIDGTEFTDYLYAVAGDNTVKAATSKWVAVGARGKIVASVDDGETWTVRETLLLNGDPVTQTLRDVRYCNGTWVAVGDLGLIMTSTDTITWTQIQETLTNRNLYTVSYSPIHATINVGGDGLILNSPATPNFTAVVTLSPDETYTLSRLWYRGSHASPQTVGIAVPVNSRLANGETVSSTLIDTDYKKGDEIGYYLVIGNILGAPQELRAGGSVITATEYRR